jgi:dihydroorotate dehydrogenase electron transfer subunit
MSVLTIRENVNIAKDVYRMKLEGSFDMQPGQFINIKVNDTIQPFLRRPISVCDIEGDMLTIIYKVFGKGTEELSKKQTGTTLDCLLDLGNGFEVQSHKTTYLVGGGVGVPPLLYLAKHLQGNLKIVLGFNNKEDVFLSEEFSKYGEVLIATMDGSLGHHGTVVDLIGDDADYYYACGPEPMLKALGKLELDGQLSFEERMGCGFGACMGCSCKTLTGYKRICVEGPVMKTEEIKWD